MRLLFSRWRPCEADSAASYSLEEQRRGRFTRFCFVFRDELSCVSCPCIRDTRSLGRVNASKNPIPARTASSRKSRARGSSQESGLLSESIPPFLRRSSETFLFGRAQRQPRRRRGALMLPAFGGVTGYYQNRCGLPSLMRKRPASRQISAKRCASFHDVRGRSLI